MKKLSKKWKIFITAMVVLIGGLYGVYKINNRNAFEEMFNSYYNFVPITALYNMPQIEPVGRKNRGEDVAKLYYKEIKNEMKIEFSLVSFDDNDKILLIGSTFIEEGVYLDVSYIYDINTHNLKKMYLLVEKRFLLFQMSRNKQKNYLKNTTSQKNTYKKNQTNY